ncbi:FAD-binding domain [Hyphococcus sp.]|uniref:FAD-binding domain n=1 Tax=Hyphococcus sp. TaxID=2038636 RepID=UPI0020816010|nr:MAG: oxidoreductase [Marinicaulis sp.]
MKIAISGAGVAGPSLAHWLLKAGHEPVLIEQAPEFRAGGYVIDFWGLGYELACRMGLEQSILDAGYQIGEIRIVTESGKTRASLDASVFGQLTNNRFTSLPRGELSRIIYTTVKDRVETMFGETMTAIEDHDSGVRVSFENSGDRAFDLVIGADGLHSNVRRLAFGPEKQFEHELGYRVAAFEVSAYQPRDELIYMLHAEPGKQIARFALRGDRTLVLLVYRAEPGAPAPREEAEQKSELRRVFANTGWESARMLEAMERVSDVYFDNVSQIRMPQWTKGRVALIGDAAAAVSLLAGEGTGLAMTESYVLAGELMKAGGDYRAAFAAYERQLQPFLAEKQKAAVNFASSFAPKTKLGMWLRVQATRLMGFAPLANLLLGPSVRDDFELPDYF